MDGLITLADLPELGAGDSPRTTIAVARLDDHLKDPRYGAFKITQADFDGWKRNLADTFGGRVSIDFDHASDRPGAARDTKAAAWITGLGQQGKLVTADVEFTPTGARSVRDGDYRHISPTFVDDYKDEHGESHGRALLGAALTNRPVLRKGMPTLSLSRVDFDDVATVETDADRARAHARAELHRLAAGPVTLAQLTAAERDKLPTSAFALPGKRAYPIHDRAHAENALARAAGKPEEAQVKAAVYKRYPQLKGAAGAKTAASDSRGRMPDLKQLAQFLELDENADAPTVLAKVSEIAPAPEPTDEERKAAKKAKKQLAADGAVTLSAEQVATLMSGANAGLAAQKQLADVQFKTAWEKALSEGRAAPAQEETMRTLFEKDAELAVKTLDSFVPIVPVKPTGSGDGADLGTAPAGMEQDRFELHRKAQQRAKTLMAERQGLDEAEAYTLAAIEIEDAAAGVEGPVF